MNCAKKEKRTLVLYYDPWYNRVSRKHKLLENEFSTFINLRTNILYKIFLTIE